MKFMIFTLSFLIAASSLAQTSKTSVKGLLKVNGSDVEFNYENGGATLDGLECQSLGGFTQMFLGACGVSAESNIALSLLLINEIPMAQVADPSLAEAYKGKNVREFLTEQFATQDVVQIGPMQIKKEDCPDEANALVSVVDSSKIDPSAPKDEMIAATQISCAKLEVK